MKHGTYIGPNEKYKGEGTLLRRGKRGKVLAQFDNIEKLQEKAHGWHEFLSKHFVIDRNE